MEIFWGLIKIDPNFLTSHPTFVALLLIIIIIALFTLTLGKTFLSSLSFLKRAYLSVPRVRRKEDWVADCRERRGWLQKGDALALELDGKYLRELSFTVKPQGKPSNWKAGFMLGNPSCSPTTIVDSQNAITCHTGAPPILDEAIPAWIYDANHDRNNPYSTLVKSNDGEVVRFFVSINEENYIRVEVQGQVVYATRLDSSFRKKVYLLAWGDSINCKCSFAGITYYI